MPTRNHKHELLQLFRNVPVFQRRDFKKMAVPSIYKTTNGLWNALDELEADGMVVIKRGPATPQHGGIKTDVRLSLHGLDWLANVAGSGVQYVPSQSGADRMEMIHAAQSNPCRTKVRLCYMHGCYLRVKCAAYKET